MQKALSQHWPEYLMEAAGLGLFMVSACVFAAALEHPASPVRQALDDPLLRRLLMGLAMGGTAVAIIYSPWGKQSGAHLNPAVTLTFLRLGKIAPWDAVFYVAAQLAGGVAGVLLAAALLGMSRIADPHVNYVVTLPGEAGVGAAFAAEFAIAFGLMLTVLILSNRHQLNRYTGLAAGLLVALYITFEAPFSGMSMNPARSFGSAAVAQHWQGLWLYFTAPPLGMLLAAELYRRVKGSKAVLCCKLNHENDKRCIFHCRYGHSARAAGAAAPALPEGGQP
ncbi:MAG TPA: aquaporin [Burkholderiales bacterium]|nr:aquaporin [Burkholderiales bacterium]